MENEQLDHGNAGKGIKLVYLALAGLTIAAATGIFVHETQRMQIQSVRSQITQLQKKTADLEDRIRILEPPPGIVRFQWGDAVPTLACKPGDVVMGKTQVYFCNPGNEWKLESPENFPGATTEPGKVDPLNLWTNGTVSGSK